ncbi:MAG: tetratricopeptide repeat protein [Myxococcaceae bacterium]
MSYKDQQKELKAPDEFQKLGAEAVPFLEKHGKQLVMGIGAVLAVGLIISIATQVSAHNEQEASREFGNALRVLDRQVNANATADATKPGEDPPFKSETEKDEAIVKSLTDFRAKRPGTKGAISAALPLAQALLRQGKADAALPLIDEYLAKADAADPLRPAAYEARGYALEAQKKLDDALSAFDQLARENKTDFMKGMGLYHRGRILMMKGDTAGAAKTFSDLQGSAPDTAAARLAKERIASLVAQGVQVPTPPPAIPTVAAVDAGL